MNATRILIIGLMLCCLTVPGFAGGFEPVEQPPMEPAPVDQAGGTCGQSGGIGNGQMTGTPTGDDNAQPTSGAAVQQTGGTGTQGCPGQTGCPAQGCPAQYGQGPVSAADFQALVMMLNLVLGDLEMCQMSLRANNHYTNDLMSIGYLNSAKSALSRARMHPAYLPLLSEIDSRLSRIKFHLVMNDEMTVRMMIAQLSAMMRSIILNQVGNGLNNGGYGPTVTTTGHGGTQIQYSQPTGSVPTITVSYPVTVVPVSYFPRITITGWGQGQNLNPPAGSVPSTLIPVSDNY